MTFSRKTTCLVITAGSMLASSGCIVPAFAQAPSYISFQVPGCQGTSGLKINNSFTVAGHCEQINSFNQHGFTRDLSGKITVFDPPGSTYTEVLDMNASGAIVGYFQSESGTPGQVRTAGYVRSAQGIYTTLTYEGNYVNPSSINDAGTIAGYYVLLSGSQQGYVRTAAGTVSPFDVPGSASTQAISINNGGTIVGSYGIGNGAAHGFVRTASGGFSYFDPTGSVQTSPSSIDAGGTITGQFIDGSGSVHGFVRSPQGKVTTFDPSGSTITVPNSINSTGTVAGYFSSTQEQGFVRTGQGTITQIEYPGASAFTSVADINDYGAVTGSYASDGVNTEFGFMMVPANLCCSGKPVVLTVQAGGYYWDGGGSKYGQTVLQEYVDYSSAGQDWTWTPVPSGFTICTLGTVCLSDNGSQVVMGTTADVFTITSTNAVLDMNTGQYIQNASHPSNGAYLSTGPTASVWAYSSNLH